MKKRSRAIWLGFFLLFPVCSIASADTIVLVADYWCPYNCNSGDQNPGFLVEISRLIFENAGHRLEYQTMPWKRAVKEGKSGAVNGIIGFTKKNVKGFITIRAPNVFAMEVFYTRAGSSWKYDGIESLKKLERVAFPNGYHYNHEIDSYIQTGRNVYLVPDIKPLKAMVKMVIYGRVESFLENRDVVEYYLKQNQIEKSIVPAGEFSKSSIFIGFGIASKTGLRDAKILSNGFDSVCGSTEMKILRKKYNLD